MLTIKRALQLLALLSASSTNSAYSYAPPSSSGQWYRPPATQPPHYGHKDLVAVYEAYNVELGFPTEGDRRVALANGDFNPESPLPIDVDVYFPETGARPKVFVTMPRFGRGVPYSLALLTDVRRPNGSELQPYPSYAWHSSHGRDCDGLTSVYRVQVDPCGRMWVLDSGEIEFVQHCAPQVVVIDLATDQLVHRYRLPPAVYKAKVSRFVTPLIDVADPPPFGRCREVFVYMADPTGSGIVVYDVVHGASWRIENKHTIPDPAFGTHTVARESFELLDGAFGLAVTPAGLGSRRHLFFHALSNDREVAVPLDVVHNASEWTSGIESALDKFVVLGRRGVQCAASAMTPQGFLLCGYLEPIAIVGWNIRTPYTPQNRLVLAENPTTLQFVSGLKVIRDPAGRHDVWMLSNRLQKAFNGITDYREINYRIQRCPLDDLLQGRPCRP